MNNLITWLLNTGSQTKMVKRFGRKRNNKGVMWASLLGLGVTAAALGLKRNRNTNMLRPVQNVMNNIRTRAAGQMPNVAAMTEFSKELFPVKNPESNK